MSTAESQPICRKAPATADPLADLLAENASSDIYLPRTFLGAIYEHILGGLVDWSRGCTPVILTITGPFGCGKSTMLSEALRRLGVQRFRLPASAAESRWAGEPAQKLKDLYLQAAEQQAGEGRPAALVIDDLDLGLGDFGATGTTNAQHTLSALMERADTPEELEGRRVDRVAVVATANDVTKLYGALHRPGRMRVFRWDPRGEDLRHIGAHILRDLLPASLVARIAAVRPSWTLAHYSQLRSHLLRASLRRAGRGCSAAELLAHLAGGGDVGLPRGRMTGETVREALDAVEAEDAAKIDYTRTNG
ncbi:MAG: AAA family ATPase [Planctomycetota bacterium]